MVQQMSATVLQLLDSLLANLLAKVRPDLLALCINKATLSRLLLHAATQKARAQKQKHRLGLLML